MLLPFYFGGGSGVGRSSAEGQERNQTPNKLKNDKTKKTERKEADRIKKKSALSSVVSVFSKYSTCVQ